MDGQEEILVGGGAKNVGHSPELDGEEGRVPKHPSQEHLQGHYASNNIFGQWLGAAKFGNL